MNVIQYCLKEVKFRIPREILDTVFIHRDQQWRITPMSVEEHITNEVIRPRVLVDLNLVGGTEVYISLENVPYHRTDDYTSIYRIPKELTQGRAITSVLNITFSDPTKVSSYGVAASVNNTTMLQVGSAVMDAMGSVPVTSTARCQLIGENVIMVRDVVILPANIFLRCIIENEDTLSHIQVRSFRHFANLVTYAVKSYIYNLYTVQLDIGQLYSGQQLGRIKDIIDEFKDSEELYQTYLTEHMQKVMLMQDSEANVRLLRLMVGGTR